MPVTPLGGWVSSSSRRSRALIDRIVSDGAIRAVYQPVVELGRRRVVGYEALARGPRGSGMERPERLLAAARAHGRLAELDRACRRAGLRGAAEARLRRPHRLFLNVEPEALDGNVLDEVDEASWIVLEVTERALTSRPAELLASVEAARAQGCAIAVDDVGADSRSLAFLPLLRPELIKLDMALVQHQPTPTVAAIVNAVNAESERSGAVILAEGIENADHLATARAMGATVGQGWYLGREGPIPRDAEGTALPLPERALRPVNSSPFNAVARRRPVQRGDAALLFAISLQLEAQAAALGSSALILSVFQRADRFTAATRGRYAELARRAAFVGALGAGMQSTPVPGVRGADLGAEDVLRGEWSVAVLGPHFSAALVAVDLGAIGPSGRRAFDFCLTYERDLVVDAASALMLRIAPLSASTGTAAAA